MTSSAVTGLPLWKTMPSFSRMTYRSAAVVSISSASAFSYTTLKSAS